MHGRRSRGTRGASPPEFGVGTLMQIVPLRFLLYMYKKKRSVAFKIRQNPFSAGALPWTPLMGSSRRSPDSLLSWRRDTPPHTPPRLAPTHLRRSPCVPQNSSQIYAYGFMVHNNSYYYTNRRRPHLTQPDGKYWLTYFFGLTTEQRRWTLCVNGELSGLYYT